MTTPIDQFITHFGGLRPTLWSIYLAAAVILPLYHLRPILKYMRGSGGIGDACLRTEATQCLWRVPALMYSVFVVPSLPLFLSIFLDLLGRVGRVLAMHASRRRWQMGQAATAGLRSGSDFGVPRCRPLGAESDLTSSGAAFFGSPLDRNHQGTTMQFTIQTHTTRLGAMASSLRAAWQGIANAVARWRLAQQRYRECEQLDVYALRDLGLDRSEHGSYLAESSGDAPATRRRVAAKR